MTARMHRMLAFFELFLNNSHSGWSDLIRTSSLREVAGKARNQNLQNKNHPMKANSALRFAVAGLFVALVALTSPLAQANCGGCGDKKECPSPTPSPSPAK